MQELVRLRSADGTSLAVWVSGNGPPLVLVHGTTVNHADWVPLLPALRRQFRVHAMDRRGSGASDDTKPYALEREFEDVAAVVDSVGEPAFLLGHSFGGLCAIEAARLTGNLRRLVLYEPPIPVEGGPNFHPPLLLDRLEAFEAAGQPDEVVATFLREVAGQDPRRVELQRLTHIWPSRVIAAHTVVREVRGAHFYHFQPDRFAAMRVPTLMLLGENSAPKHQVTTPAIASALPDARIVLLPGQGHIAMHTATALFLREVLAFLTEDGSS